MLPASVLQKIIKEASSCRGDLTRLARVNKAFLPLARKELYGCLYLTTFADFDCLHDHGKEMQEEPDEVEDKMNSDCEQSLRFFNNFVPLYFTLAKHPHLRPFVKRMDWRFMFIGSYLDLDCLGGDAARPEELFMEFDYFARILNFCSSLSEFAIETNDWIGPALQCIGDSVILGGLKEFRIFSHWLARNALMGDDWQRGCFGLPSKKQVEKTEMEALMEVLIGTEALESLELPFIPWANKLASNAPRPTFQLKALRINSPESIPDRPFPFYFLSDILKNSFSTLVMLAIPVDLRFDFVTWTNLFPSLTGLELLIYSQEYPHDATKKMLSTCPKLERLWLTYARINFRPLIHVNVFADPSYLPRQVNPIELVADATVFNALPPKLIEIYLGGISFCTTTLDTLASPSCLPFLRKMRHEKLNSQEDGDNYPDCWTPDQFQDFLQICQERYIDY